MIRRKVALLACVVAGSAIVGIAACSADDPAACAGASCSDDAAPALDATTSDSPNNAPDGAIDPDANVADAPANGLSLSLSPSSVMMRADAGVTVSVSVSRPAGVSGPVDVTIDGLGLAFTAPPIQIAADKSAGDLVLTSSPNVPQGMRVLPVTAKLGALRGGAPLSVTVTGAPGDLDGTFGLVGRLKLVLGGSDGANDVVLQPDGKILIGVNIDSGGGVVRLLPDGHLDTSFGTGGVAKTVHTVIGVHLRADGKIVAAGSKFSFPAASPAGITRFTSNGAPDTTFGKVDAGVPGTLLQAIDPKVTEVYALAAQPDESILVAGDVTDFNYYRCFIARFTPDGALDTTFATGGVYTSDDTCEWLAGPIRVSSTTGAIYVNGTRYIASTEVPVVAKFTSAGAVDTTFASSGFLLPPVAGYTTGLVLLPGDALLVGVATSNVTLSRFLSTGALDTSFGVSGTSATVPGSVTDFVIQPDGKIAVAASVSGDFLAMRLSASGALDTTFAGTGSRRTDFGGGGDNPTRVIVLPGNALLLAGSSSGHVALAKYLP